MTPFATANLQCVHVAAIFPFSSQLCNCRPARIWAAASGRLDLAALSSKTAFRRIPTQTNTCTSKSLWDPFAYPPLAPHWLSGWSAPTPAAQAMIRDDDLAWMRPIRDSPAPADPSDGNVQQAVRCGILRLSPPLPHTRGPRGADSHASYAPTVSARFTDALFACVCVVGVSRDAQGRRAAPAAGGEQRLRAAARGARSRHRVGGRKDRTGDLVSPVPACLL